MSDLVRFGVSLEQDLLESFDQFSQERGYANRSEALRHLIRKELAEKNVAQPDAPVAGVLTLVYDHHTSDLPRRLTNIQHDAHDAVLATMHVHLDRHNCLEVMALRGASSAVCELSDKLRSAKGIMQSSLALTSLENSASATITRRSKK